MKNMELKKIKITEDLAYFIGVLHSDGCIYRFNNKKENRVQVRINLTVGKKSILMSEKFQKIFFNEFNRSVNIRKVPKKESYVIQTSINRIYPIIKEWEKLQIPLDIKLNSKLFGAYLAGVIDGDGHIKIKRKGKACQIRISSGMKWDELLCLIKEKLQCSAHFEKDINKKGVGYSVCFLISKKNYRFLDQNVVNHLVIPYKIKRMKEHIKKK